MAITTKNKDPKELKLCDFRKWIFHGYNFLTNDSGINPLVIIYFRKEIMLSLLPTHPLADFHKIYCFFLRASLSFSLQTIERLISFPVTLRIN